MINNYCICVYVLYGHMCVFFHNSWPFIFEATALIERSSLFWLGWLETKKTGICLSLLQQCWCDRYTQPLMAFMWMLGIQTQDLVHVQQALLPTESPPPPSLTFLLFKESILVYKLLCSILQLHIMDLI